MESFIVARGTSEIPGSALELQTDLENALNAQVEQANLIGLAGPNETIQVLASAAPWLSLLAGFVGGKVLEGFVSQFGANAADRLIERFKLPSSRQSAPADNPKVDVDRFTQALSNAVIKFGHDQSLVVGFPLPSGVKRNAGIDLTQLLNGDPRHDQLILLRSAIALVAMGKRMPSLAQVTYYAPQNSDCSAAIRLEGDGTFGGVYKCSVESISSEADRFQGYQGAGMYQLTLRFDAAGECLEDRMERVGDHWSQGPSDNKNR